VIITPTRTPTMTLSLSSSPQCLFPSTNLVSYWKLDEASGILYDSKGSYNSISFGGTYGQPGKIGNSILIDNSNENVALPDMPELTVTSNSSISFACWLYPIIGAPPYQYSVFFGDWDIGPVFYLYRNNETTTWNARYWVGGAAAQIANITITNLQWYHLAWVKNGNIISFYQNGSFMGSAADPATGINNPSTIVLGGSGPDNVSGRIDEAGFWNRALTSTEVSILYNGGNGLAYCVSTTPVPSITPTKTISRTPTKSFVCNLVVNINVVNT
jgi:hypothetical protein